MIRQRGSKYQAVSEDGTKNLGTFDSKAEAEHRLKQIEYFKHEKHARNVHRYVDK